MSFSTFAWLAWKAEPYEYGFQLRFKVLDAFKKTLIWVNPSARTLRACCKTAEHRVPLRSSSSGKSRPVASMAAGHLQVSSPLQHQAADSSSVLKPASLERGVRGAKDFDRGARLVT